MKHNCFIGIHSWHYKAEDKEANEKVPKSLQSV